MFWGLNWTRCRKIKWCEICGEGWIVAVKNRLDNRLYCVCTETQTVWKHPDDTAKRHGSVTCISPASARLLDWHEEDVIAADFIEAEEQEVLDAGWNIHTVKEEYSHQ